MLDKKSFQLNLIGVEDEFIFEPVELNFIELNNSNIFGSKNNHTLKETLAQRRYSKLNNLIQTNYASFVDVPLGKFLLQLKTEGDPTYLKFLNKYGDLNYCHFEISNQEIFSKSGIYAYFYGSELKYIGRCKDNMKKRVNQGYGKIHPKNCYIDGQTTNCHLNSKINENHKAISLWLAVIQSQDEIEKFEDLFIKQYQPPWNIRK